MWKNKNWLHGRYWYEAANTHLSPEHAFRAFTNNVGTEIIVKPKLSDDKINYSNVANDIFIKSFLHFAYKNHKAHKSLISHKLMLRTSRIVRTIDALTVQ